MLYFLAGILQDPTQTIPTGGDGFNWTDYGPLGVMAAGLVTAVVILWRKLEREQNDGRANAEKVLTVLIQVNSILPDVLAAVKERGADVSPALTKIDATLEELRKELRSLTAATKRRAKG